MMKNRTLELLSPWRRVVVSNDVLSDGNCRLWSVCDGWIVGKGEGGHTSRSQNLLRPHSQYPASGIHLRTRLMSSPVSNSLCVSVPPPIHLPSTNTRGTCTKTRQLSYRKEDRAMRPIYGCPEKFCESSLRTQLLFHKFVMDFCSD